MTGSDHPGLRLETAQSWKPDMIVKIRRRERERCFIWVCLTHHVSVILDPGRCHTGGSRSGSNKSWNTSQTKNIVLSKPINRLFSPTFHSTTQSLNLSLKASETLLHKQLLKAELGKVIWSFCLFKRSEIHTTMDKLIQNVPLMHLCLGAFAHWWKNDFNTR